MQKGMLLGMRHPARAMLHPILVSSFRRQLVPGRIALIPLARMRPAPPVPERKAVTNLYQTVVQNHTSITRLERARPTLDDARPTQTAGILLRVLQKESAVRTMEPFFAKMVERALGKEREQLRAHPSQANTMILGLFGKTEMLRAFHTLSFYREERLNSIHRRFRRFTLEETRMEAPLLTVKEKPMPKPEKPQETDRRQVAAEVQETVFELPPQERRALVQSVAGEVRRQLRMEALRRGK